MASRYTVVQYVPDPAAGERMNIGVIVWNPQRICARFVTDWRRAREFGGENVQFLRDFAARIADMGARPAADPDCGALERMIVEWRNSIQFTEPRGSVAEPQALVQRAAGTFLREHPRKPMEHGRQDAALLAYDTVIAVARRFVPDAAQGYVRYDELVEGKHDRHYVDIALVDGRIIGVVNALHFDGSQTAGLEMELDATAWAVDDLRKLDRRVRTAVFALPPRNSRFARSYERAARVFGGLKTPILDSEAALRAWTEQRARRFSR